MAAVLNTQMKRKFIVITSIFPPTEAVKRFSELEDYSLVVVGDLKSPEEYELPEAKFLSVNLQKKLGFRLSDLLPFNHYCRKNLGYLYAAKNNADYIIDTDDDNIPYKDGGFPDFKGNFLQAGLKPGFVNIYKYFTKQNIWPRGYPLRLLAPEQNVDFPENLPTANVKIGFWQGLADEDPDVDAIYRLLYNTPCTFEKKPPLTLKKGVISPFNSQNTACIKELFPLLYLPSTVSFRFTDILRSFIAQPVMWMYDYHLGFTSASVKQLRNVHDYMKDFESEIPVYLNTELVVENVMENVSPECTIAENLFLAYESLVKCKVVQKEELVLLKAWIDDLE